MNRRLLIPIGAGIVVLVLWFVALWGPQGSALSKARKRATTAEQQRGTLRDQLTRLQQSKRDEPLKRSQLETLRVAVPDDPNLAQFILDANDAASRSGIDFLSITPTPPTAAGGQAGTQAGTTPTTVAGGGGGAAPVSIRLGMTITGGYFQVLDFVNRLNRLPRLVVVDTVSVSSGASGPLQVQLTARMFTTSPRPVAGSTGGAGGGGGAGGTTTTTGPGGSTTTTTPGLGGLTTTTGRP
jgi:Tfp pilus assembly protein PilO